uniref:Uncharacterized protein n=1 Tax=Nelumbo nucifera TaxID=4432 RepID=A0A822Z2Z7_NELNU|nr:TPA_asm: hypothetical protein HUJ06_013205 [Nelumbo nucifera]
MALNFASLMLIRRRDRRYWMATRAAISTDASGVSVVFP